MKVIFRTDASVAIGSGHAMRCLTLAAALREKGAEVVFICRELKGNLCAFIEEKGYRVRRLPVHSDSALQKGLYARWLGVDIETDAAETMAAIEKEGQVRWLVIDSYAIDKRWEARMRPFVSGIMVIDDLADREHDCDILLNQNLYDDMEERYAGKLPIHCKRLFGPEYALIRPEFRDARLKRGQRHGSIRRILVFYGGSDLTNETSKALRAIQSLNMPQVAVDVVVGKANPNREEIEKHAFALPNAAFYCQTDDMAELMSRADLALGAGGSSSWERCCMGLPAIVTVVAENQAAIAENLAKRGIVINLGWHADAKEADIQNAVKALMDDRQKVLEMGKRALGLVDGDGALRAVKEMI
ncbi:MAG: UDP-2,4-diacetamido-2,4,6-trideoxy-beta-L-altropyranose hydrolase [Deltaproteobacteria bacterium]|nr:UDP-2,4-diacetamido-2,4,6-trideoxy-beta-L-altropyranose hydrolase [Deltaproteobacteria bacterium]